MSREFGYPSSNLSRAANAPSIDRYRVEFKQLVVCIDNKGYAVSLEKRTIYVELRDAAAEKHGLLRIVDESGEDYLYPKKSFRPIALPLAVKGAVLDA